ncbi:hypothetical protein Scep_009942 [Stephania cephalantha]|uniref:Amine oxidase domain-containing protein n=1 Tax=Stephania cephalantha TaxID=152367 RepID=A0AAP0PGR3_9MAGN
MMRRVAVVGAGIGGLGSAIVLARAGIDVVLFEKEEYLGGHARTISVDGTDLDLGFMVFNRVTYPNTMEFLENLGVEMEKSDMSFAVSLENGQGYEWGSRNGFSSLFAQKKNMFNPYFYLMIREMLKFKTDVIKYLEEHEHNPDIDQTETLGAFIKSRAYSDLFVNAYLIPICASIWSCPSEGVLNFSAFAILSFCRNHHLLQLFGRPQWLTVRWRSHTYVNKVQEELQSRGCQIRTGCAVQSITSHSGGCTISCMDGSHENFDGCVIAVHAPDALNILGEQATQEERRVLGAFQYVYSDIFLHRDKNLMPRNQAAWSAWNFLGTVYNKVCLTYWLNVLQNIDEIEPPFLVTLNPPHRPENTLLKWTTSHPFPSVAAFKASQELTKIQGKRKIWFCGAYQGYGFHEDGLKAGMVAAHSLLGESYVPLKNSKHMVPSWTETGARIIVTNLLEEGGTIFSFEGANKKCALKSVIRIHNPQFYWKVATEADLGLADAYIQGYFSFVGEEDFLNLFMIFIVIRDMNTSGEKQKSKRGWWTPLLFTAGIASAKYFLRHFGRQNTVTQSRRNISRHYDLSNDLFALFLDETMTYSSAIFKTENEDLKTAQLRKISLLIEKARINNNHEILEIGCGWGSFAIEVVRRTGCKYTGITLSEEQLQYAEKKVKEAGLQDRIKFLLCDYRQLPNNQKYDRILSCEMIEAIGHEFMEDFFRCCESALAEDGLLVLQFISIPDERYDEYRQSSDFIKEYIFPGGCLPSLSRLTSAMVSASRLCKILKMGFDEKFIRTWEYYYIYCAAGFKTRTLGNYQIVFSRPGNTAAFCNPYEAIPSA